MANRFQLVDISCCTEESGFYFITIDNLRYRLSIISRGRNDLYKLPTKENLLNDTAGQSSTSTNPIIPYLNVTSMGGITNLLRGLNTGFILPDTDILKSNWMVGKIILENNGTRIQPNITYKEGQIKILPVISHGTNAQTMQRVTRTENIIDSSYQAASASAAAQPGGSLYDNKGKLLYRGQMKNGLPHGYGTGYYANGKVGHTGMFKGGKIVQ